MKYNVFDSRTYKKITKCEVNHDNALHILHHLGALGGFNILNNPYVIQGVYSADQKGFSKFLDDMGWERCGQNYEAFVYAMENGELYSN